jgi:hypothetical protein
MSIRIYINVGKGEFGLTASPLNRIKVPLDFQYAMPIYKEHAALTL